MPETKSEISVLPPVPPLPDIDTSDYVSVKTTLPILGKSEDRKHVLTERLLLRPVAPSDLQAAHRLRTQPEVMKWTAFQRVDADLAVTQTKIDQFLPPNDITNFNCAICLKDTGELIGMGGNHKRDGWSFGWPELGYMFVKEAWGKGYASEFVKAFVHAYAELPREEVEIRVKPNSVVQKGDGTAEECLIGMTTTANLASQRVMSKSGGDQWLSFQEPDLANPSVMANLVGYRWFPMKPAGA